MNNKIQLVVVDDNPIFLEGMATFLSSGKYEIMARFASGIALLENINDYDPDLVLLDIEMPVLNGIETARKLNRFGVQLKLVAITLYHDNVYIKELMEAGFRGMVNKNKVSDQLYSVLDLVLEGELVFPDSKPENEGIQYSGYVNN